MPTNINPINKFFVKLSFNSIFYLSVVTRRCTSECSVNGIRIPENLTIAVDVMTLHFDPQHWGEDANEFNPLRFSPEIKRHPAVYLPFGLGPRVCVGMRLALIELKLTLAKLVSKYDLVKTAETPMPDKLEFIEMVGSVRHSRVPLKLKIVPRQTNKSPNLSGF